MKPFHGMTAWRVIVHSSPIWIWYRGEGVENIKNKWCPFTICLCKEFRLQNTLNMLHSNVPKGYSKHLVRYQAIAFVFRDFGGVGTNHGFEMSLADIGHWVLQLFSIWTGGNLSTSLCPALRLYPMNMDTLSLTALTLLWKVKVRSCRTETLRKQMSEKTRWIWVVIQVFQRSGMWFTQKGTLNSKLAMLSAIKVVFRCWDAMWQLEHMISSSQPQFPLTAEYCCTLCSHILENW